MRVLVVEDDEVLGTSIREALHRDAFAADWAGNGTEALEYLDIHAYDAVVLDRGIPDIHGDEICRWIVQNHPEIYILMLSVASDIHDKIDGLSLGADDYMTKPFEFLELSTRLRTLSRRPRSATPVVLRAEDVELDVFRHEVRRGGRDIHLSRKQFAVLEILMRAQGSPVSAEDLLEKAWDLHTDPFTTTVRVTISTLRRKLGPPNLIHAIPGVGYTFHT